ncbi:MAG: DUF47 domain-containing protein [Chloroflexi bacterium]|nr:DUF47 domain-containing protein [Chloroflexota bacterium]
MFEEGSKNLLAASLALVDLIDNFEDVEKKVERLTDLEHVGDGITHKIFGQLHKTFVTPIDREDIALLAHSLDDVVDFIESAADTMVIYKVRQTTPAARELALRIVRVSEEVNKAIPMLRTKKMLMQVLEHCIEINRLENEADDIMRSALAELFDNCANGGSVLDAIKWREIYEQLESATDRGEDIANVLEGVVLKHA